MLGDFVDFKIRKTFQGKYEIFSKPHILNPFVFNNKNQTVLT